MLHEKQMNIFHEKLSLRIGIPRSNNKLISSSSPFPRPTPSTSSRLGSQSSSCVIISRHSVVVTGFVSVPHLHTNPSHFIAPIYGGDQLPSSQPEAPQARTIITTQLGRQAHWWQRPMMCRQWRIDTVFCRGDKYLIADESRLLNEIRSEMEMSGLLFPGRLAWHIVEDPRAGRVCSRRYMGEPNCHSRCTETEPFHNQEMIREKDRQWGLDLTLTQLLCSGTTCVFLLEPMSNRKISFASFRARSW